MKKFILLIIISLVVVSLASCDSIGEELESFSQNTMSQIVDAVGDIFKDAGDTSSTSKDEADVEQSDSGTENATKDNENSDTGGENSTIDAESA